MHCVFVILATFTQHLHQFTNQAPQRPVLQICNITSNCFALKDFVSSLTVLLILSDVWVVLIQKTQNIF